MEAKDRNTATATVADELKAQRRNLTADEWKLIRFSEAEIQELEGLASEEARQDAPRFIVPIFNRHAAELESMANNPEFVKDVFFYAHVFDRDIGGMLQDMAQYSGVIDDAAELHNRIAAHGDKWLLIAEGMRRTYWYFQGCMIREMGGEEYARAIVAFYKSGAKPEYIELDDMPPNGCDTKKRGEANEMGEEKDRPPLIIYHEYLDGLEKSTPDELYKLLHPLMAWHLGREYARPEGLAGIAFDAIQASVERALKIGNVNRNNGRVKSEKKAEAARKNGRHGGRPKKENPTKTQRKPNPNTNTNTILSLNNITSLEDILGGGGGKEPPPPPTKSIEHDRMDDMERPTAQEVSLAAGRLGIASDVVDKWLKYMDKVDWHFSGGDNVTRRTFRQSLSRFAERESEIKSEVAKPSNRGASAGMPIGVVHHDPNYQIRL